MEKNKKFTFGENIFSIFVILLPFLYQYAGIIDQISLGETLLIPFITRYIFSDLKNRIKVNKFVVYFYYYVIASTIFCMGFNYFDLLDSGTFMIRLLFHALLILIAKDHFNWEFAKKIYGVFVLGFSLYLILQYIFNKISGFYLPIYLNYDLLFFPEQRAPNLSKYYGMYGFRPSSLFLEPSYFTLFCLPYISIKPFEEKSKIKDKILLLIVALALYLSGSSSGIVAIAIVSILYLLSILRKIRINRMIIYILILFVISLSCVWFVNTDFNDNALARVQHGGSINTRVTRGLIIYNELPVIHKIFGVGLNNIEAYMNYNNISTIYDEANKNYVCSLLQTLNFSGMIGLILLSIYLLYMWKISKNNNDSKSLFFILIFSLSYETILFSYRFSFLYIILYAISKKESIKI